jgi:hypothetical protein
VVDVSRPACAGATDLRQRSCSHANGIIVPRWILDASGRRVRDGLARFEWQRR